MLSTQRGPADLCGAFGQVKRRTGVPQRSSLGVVDLDKEPARSEVRVLEHFSRVPDRTARDIPLAATVEDRLARMLAKPLLQVGVKLVCVLPVVPEPVLVTRVTPPPGIAEQLEQSLPLPALRALERDITVLGAEHRVGVGLVHKAMSRAVLQVTSEQEAGHGEARMDRGPDLRLRHIDPLPAPATVPLQEGRERPARG